MKIKAKKSLGQHWLRDKATLFDVVTAAEITKDDIVLEVGPGLGALTEILCESAKQVIAVEADSELISPLKVQFYNKPNVEFVEADILTFDLGVLPSKYKVAANIPYYLTSNLIRILLEANNPPDVMALLIQKEVAERIIAQPGQMSVLAFSVQYYAKAQITRAVGKELFDPPPKVESAILQIIRRDKPVFSADREKLFKLVKAGFGEKRKMLRNALAGGLRLETSQVEELLQKSGLPANARAQELSLDDWRQVYNNALALQII